MGNRRIQFFDTTLRDGEQSPGICLGIEEKVEIGLSLARLKVDVIEAGFPAASPGDLAAVQAVAADPVLQALHRIVQQRRPCPRAGQPVAPVATRGEMRQPAPQRRIPSRLQVQRRIRSEHPLQGPQRHPGCGQRRRMAGRDGAAVAMRGGPADGSGLDHPHPAPALQQRQRRGQADRTATEDQHLIDRGTGHACPGQAAMRRIGCNFQ